MEMKIFRMNVNAWALAALMGMGLCATACSSDDDGKDVTDDWTGTRELADGTTLNGYIKAGQTVVLKQGYSFKLTGEYVVADGGLLKIEPGVTIKANNTDATADYIMVEKGGKIDAQGTADSPIVMTVEKEPQGTSLGKNGWCGLHICGKAHTNKGTGTKSEVGDRDYGSGKDTANDNDNSGTLRYVRLEYAGYAFTPEKEANGLTLYGVGSGTTIDHIQVYRGADDGVEFFGGSANVKYFIATDCEDDSFDWTEGWNGKGQFWVADQRGTTGEAEASGDANGDCLIEADNNGDDPTASPMAHPVLANLTLIGNNSEVGKRGIRLRAGTEAEIYNAIVIGKANCLTVETENTENTLAEGTSKLQYVVLSGNFNSKEGIYTQELFLGADNHNAVSSTAIPAFAADDFVGVIDGGVKVADSFFTEAQYTGAVKAGDAGWNLDKAWIRK